MTIKITELFKEPKIMAVCGDVNSGKSLLLYWLISELEKDNLFNLYTYGLKVPIGNAQVINSVEELEQIKDSVIIIDEVMNLWDLDNRVIKRQIENTLRLINHHNNILIVCGVPNNFRKFIAGKLNVIIYKKVSFDDFVNGSKIKYNALKYRGVERGTSILNLEPNRAVVYDGHHYYKLEIPYLEQYDTKRNNVKIVKKKVNRNVNRND